MSRTQLPKAWGYSKFYVPDSLWDDYFDRLRIVDAHRNEGRAVDVTAGLPTRSGTEGFLFRPVSPFEIFLERRRRAAGMYYDPRVAAMHVK